MSPDKVGRPVFAHSSGKENALKGAGAAGFLVNCYQDACLKSFLKKDDLNQCVVDLSRRACCSLAMLW
jgi:hypothetical protein